MAKYLTKERGDLNEVASDNDNDKDDDDDDNDDDGNNKDAEVVKIGTGEALAMLYRLGNLKYLPKEERSALVTMKDKLEKIRVLT